MLEDFASATDVTDAWRPLKDAEAATANYWASRASRAIRRRWPDVDARIASGVLDKDDVRDVVVDLVVDILGGPPVNGARSWQRSAGSESMSVTLGGGLYDPRERLTFAGWMVELLDGGVPTPRPIGSFPTAGRYEHLFIWSEGSP